MNQPKLLNTLIVACRDDVIAQSAAAKTSTTATSRSHLEDLAQRRGSFVAELSELVSRQGGSPATGGSGGEAIRAAVQRVRSLVIGHNAGDSYATCARVEGKAQHLYERALERPMSEDVRAVVTRQLAEIAVDCDLLRRLRSGGKQTAQEASS